jgi:hypothetical protein
VSENETPGNDQAPDSEAPAERRDRAAEAADQAADSATSDAPADDQIPAEELESDETDEKPAESDITPESEGTSGSQPDEQDAADPVAPPETPDPPAADEPIGASESAAATGIEAAAEAAAAEEPAPATEPTPAPEPPPAVAMPKQGAKAQASTRRKQISKPDAAPNANAAHLAAKKAARPEPPPPKPKTEEQIAAEEKKAAIRDDLDKIADELAALDKQRDLLLAAQQELVSPTVDAAKPRPFVEIHREVLARSKEIREQRVRDRLKLLAKGAGMSPLDRALGERKRADADPQPIATE